MTWAIFEETHLGAIREILNGSDRVVAIVGGALLDDTLRRTLRERLRNHKDIENKLFKVGGALGNMVPKIDMLFMLQAIEKPVRDTLYGLADIRNLFAHNLNADLKSGGKMAEAVAKLTLHVDREKWPHHWLNEDKNVKIDSMDLATPRDIVITNLRICLILLMRDRVSHVTWSNVPLSPEEIRENFNRVEAAKLAHAKAGLGSHAPKIVGAQTTATST